MKCIVLKLGLLLDHHVRPRTGYVTLNCETVMTASTQQLPRFFSLRYSQQLANHYSETACIDMFRFPYTPCIVYTLKHPLIVSWTTATVWRAEWEQKTDTQVSRTPGLNPACTRDAIQRTYRVDILSNLQYMKQSRTEGQHQEFNFERISGLHCHLCMIHYGTWFNLQ